MKKVRSLFKNRTFLRILIATFTIAIIFAGYIFYNNTHDRVFMDNSIVDAPVVNISPDTSAKVLKFYVEEGDIVKKGDVLAIIGSQTLKAYNDGIILQINNQIGSNASPQSPVISMIAKSDMRIVGTIDENKGLKDIKSGQVVSFTVDALPGKTFWGFVDRVAPSAKQTQIAFSISSQRPTQQFEVFAQYNASAYPEIKNGMSAKMTVFTKTP